MVNEQRAANGLPALVSDPTLDAAAQAWANYIGVNHLFQHSTSDWRNSMISGAGWIYSGENIAAGYRSAAAVMDGWMNSPGHRANILRSNYSGVGVGHISVPGSPYGSYWVQIFASSLPRVALGNAPTISGGTAIGQTLTASASGWPGPATLSWSWRSNGSPIPGATGKTYVPTLSDGGRTVTVQVTGNQAGLYPSSKVSSPSSVVSGAPESARLSGGDRYATAVAISVAGFDPGVSVVYVASGTNFPDALAAAPAASLLGGPLLLTRANDLPSVVVAELRRLKPETIVIAGGPSAVSSTVREALEAIAPTRQISGNDRFATSRALVADAWGQDTPSEIAYIATGLNFPDALIAGAAASSIDAPVLLVNGSLGQVDSSTLTLLRTLGVTTVRIAGSPSVVSTGIRFQLEAQGFLVQRAEGADRFGTAVAINNQAFDSAPTIYLALATNFPDALAGAALAGSVGAPLFIASGGCIPASIERGMTALNPSEVVLLGGTATLNDDVRAFLRC